jgi:hypothetical protein
LYAFQLHMSHRLQILMSRTVHTLFYVAYHTIVTGIPDCIVLNTVTTKERYTLKTVQKTSAAYLELHLDTSQ